MNEKDKVRDILEGANRHINEEGCWIWLGGTLNGYGYLRWGNKSYWVHRLSLWIYKNFNLDSGKVVLHRCSRRDCYNPSHLSEGTMSDNIQESVEIRTHRNSRKTHCKQGHPYSELNTTWNNRGQRICRICRIEKGH